MKTAIVTGASRGIGRAVLEKLISEGYIVVANCFKNPQLLTKADAESTSRDAGERGENVAGKDAVSCEENVVDKDAVPCEERGSYFVHVGDVGDDEYCRELVAFAKAKLGHIDVIVNNAGICVSGLIQDIDHATFKRMMDTNFSSVYSMCHYAVPEMLGRGGCIVNVSSVWGLTGAACDSVYSASKAAGAIFTKSLAMELESTGIRVNAIAPGAIDTDMNRGYSAEEIAELVKEIPIGRMYRPDEVAEEIYKIINSEMNGEVVKFDGGWT